jgi:hypothetical protein
MNIAGKVFCWWLVFTSYVFAACDVRVDILNSTGSLISKVAIGVPFKLHVVVTGDCNVKNLLINGLNRFASSSMGTIQSVSNINGTVTRSVIYRYSVRIDQIGKYEFDPIEAHGSNGLLGSSSAAIEVVENLGDEVDAFPSAKLEISKKRVYVGEELVANFRLYFKNMQISAAGLNLSQDFEDLFDVDPVRGPHQGAEIQNGEKVDFCEWETVFSARKDGQLILPAASIDFEKIDQTNLYSFFGHARIEKLFTNAQTLEVVGLPPTKQKVLGIGTFDSFVAEVDDFKIKDGQGAQLRLSLRGAGNWSKINTPILSIPDGLQVYESKSYLEGRHTKVFEFVIQGLEKGVYELPRCDFFYFNVDDEQYHTLQTEPIRIEVLAVGSQQVSQSVDNNILNDDIQHAVKIKPILTIGSIHHRRGFYIPPWLFMSLVLMPFLTTGLWFWRKAVLARKAGLFFNLVQQLNDLEQRGSNAQIYNIFIVVFVKYYKLQKTQINKESIDRILSASGVPKKELSKFSIFFDQLLTAAFSNSLKDNDLFKQSHYWLVYLEEFVKS